MSADDYVIFNKRILKFVGLYPVNLTRYFMCLFSMFLIVVPQMVQLYLGRNDFSVVLETSSVLLTILLAILKSMVWLFNGETSKLIQFLTTDYWLIAESFDTNSRIERYAKLGKNVTRGYFFLIVNALVVFFTLQPLKAVLSKLQGNHEGNMDKETSFPFPAAYPKFCYETPFYEITYGSQTVATASCGLVIHAMDTLIATALFHTCGHFQILQDNLANLHNHIDEVKCEEKINNKNAPTYSNDVSTNLHKRLTTLIRHHQLVIRFSDCIERAFSPIMFLQVLASSIIICLVGFQVCSTTSEKGRLVEYFSYLVMALFQILLFCWPGGEMISYSSSIGDAAFSMKWYDASNRIKMGIRLIILRSQKPKRLTAGGFHTMSMESFTSILSTAISYLTLLRSVKSD